MRPYVKNGVQFSRCILFELIIKVLFHLIIGKTVFRFNYFFFIYIFVTEEISMSDFLHEITLYCTVNLHTIYNI